MLEPQVQLASALRLLQAVYCEDDATEDDSLREMVEVAVQRLYDALNPVV